MRYSEEIIDEVRSRNDIVDVISGYIKLQKKGATYFGLCPFHNEKSPSFSVSPNKQMYYCFGCQEGGNVYTFIRKYENYTFNEAVIMLAERVGMDLPKGDYTKEDKLKRDKKDTLLEIYKQAAVFYNYELKQKCGESAYNYLKSRELSDEIIKKFGLGYSPQDANTLYKYLKEKGYTDDTLKDTGLFSFSEKGAYDKFWNRVMFPILDANRKVIGFGGRVMGDAKPKYLNSPETMIFDKGRNLYGLYEARATRKSYFIVCEGYMDVIAMHQAGFTNAVASLGTALTANHAVVIKRFVKEVILAYDSDGAGVKAALRAIPMLEDNGVHCKVLSMKPYKDPDEFIKNLGTEEFENRISNARDSFLFEIDKLKDTFNLNEPKAKSEFYSEVASRLLKFSDELERNVYVEAVAREFMIPLESLKKSVNTKALSYNPQETKKSYDEEERKAVSHISKSKDKDDGVKSAQRILLTWLIDEPSLYATVKEYITVNDFIDPIYNKVAALCFKQLEEGNINPGSIVDRFEDEADHSEVAKLLNSTLSEKLTVQEKEKALNETVIKVKKNSLDHQSRTLTDIVDMQRIIKEQAQLRKIHIKL